MAVSQAEQMTVSQPVKMRNAFCALNWKFNGVADKDGRSAQSANRPAFREISLHKAKTLDWHRVARHHCYVARAHYRDQMRQSHKFSEQSDCDEFIA